MKLETKFILLALPLAICFGIFYVFPFAYSFYYAVVDSAFSHDFVGLRNFASILANEYYQLALHNTFAFVLTGTPILVSVSLLLSTSLYGMRGDCSLIRCLFILPMLLPTASVVPFIKQVFTSTNSDVLSFLQQAYIPESLIITLPVYFLYIWKNAGLNILLFISTYTAIPYEIYEAAAIDGAGRMIRFTCITLPLIRPTLFYVILLSIVQALRIFKEAYLLYGAYPHRTIYMVQHYMNNHFYKLNYQLLTAGAIFFATIVYIIIAIAYRIERKVDILL